MSEIFKIEMGGHVKDRISGFEGVVTGRVEYITGCRQYLVNPRHTTEKGDYIDGRYFDEERLAVLKAEPFALETGAPGPGEAAPIK